MERRVKTKEVLYSPSESTNEASDTSKSELDEAASEETLPNSNSTLEETSGATEYTVVE